MMGKQIKFVCWQQNTKVQYIHSPGDFLWLEFFMLLLCARKSPSVCGNYGD